MGVAFIFEAEPGPAPSPELAVVFGEDGFILPVTSDSGRITAVASWDPTETTLRRATQSRGPARIVPVTGQSRDPFHSIMAISSIALRHKFGVHAFRCVTSKARHSVSFFSWKPHSDIDYTADERKQWEVRQNCHTRPRNHLPPLHLNLGWTSQPCIQLSLCSSADELAALRERPTSLAVVARKISMLLYLKPWRTFATCLAVATAELLYSALQLRGIVRTGHMDR